MLLYRALGPELPPDLAEGAVLLGLSGPGTEGAGAAPNELTSSDARDAFAGTPHHKYVRARVEVA